MTILCQLLDQVLWKNATVVFDGYASSTKDSAHIQQAKGKVRKTIILSLSNQLTVAKDKFLVNKENKENALFGSILSILPFSMDFRLQQAPFFSLISHRNSTYTDPWVANKVDKCYNCL